MYNYGEVKSLQDIERSLIKRYRKDIWAKFIRAIREYDLIQDGDKIAVAISGGKDSIILAKLLQELKRHGRDNFSLEFIAMDPGYPKESRKLLEENAKILDIPLKIFDSNVFAVADKLAQSKPCFMCARMRRGFLYSKAEELGCNKLALGHHLDDVVETIMLNVLCSANYKTMMPKLKSDNFDNMEIIRPLYYIEEKDIIRFTNYTGLKMLDCACTVAKKEEDSKRADIKRLISNLEDDFDNVKMSIFRSAENVNLDGVIKWEKSGKKHSFLDEY